jgi:hypothetical protein
LGCLCTGGPFFVPLFLQERTIALVYALARLHNFCINEKDGEKDGNDAGSTLLNDQTDEIQERDEDHPQRLVQMNAIHYNEYNVPDKVPTDLLDAGDHFDDCPWES